MPRMTLGAYLMRQHRLLALRGLLEADEQARLGHAQYSSINQVWPIELSVLSRAPEELGCGCAKIGTGAARWRAWKGAAEGHCATAAENRMMIGMLLNMLHAAPPDGAA